MTTWDPNNKSATETLSAGNLTATSSGVGTVAATRTATADLSYFEAKSVTLPGTVAIGFVNRAYNMASGTILGTDANGVGFKSTGAVVINGTTVATIQTYVATATIGVAINLQQQLLWFTTNGTTWNNAAIGSQNPVGNVGGISFATLSPTGPLFPAISGTATGAIWTGTFATASFAYTPPTGYVSVDTCGATATNSNTPKGAAYSAVGGAGNHQVNPTIAARCSWLGMGISIAPGDGAFTPAGAITAVAGTVKENTTPVAKIVRLYDNNTGALLGATTSNPSTGAYTIPAVGSTLTFAVAFDPTSFQAQVYDRVTPV